MDGSAGDPIFGCTPYMYVMYLVLERIIVPPPQITCWFYTVELSTAKCRENAFVIRVGKTKGFDPSFQQNSRFTRCPSNVTNWLRNWLAGSGRVWRRGA
eukprot:6746369-Prymnesium_polylepis.1